MRAHGCQPLQDIKHLVPFNSKFGRLSLLYPRRGNIFGRFPLKGIDDFHLSGPLPLDPDRLLSSLTVNTVMILIKSQNAGSTTVFNLFELLNQFIRIE
jgi:hypothetical protein